MMFRTLKRQLAAAAFALGLASLWAAGARAEEFTSISAADQAHEMGRGVNVLGYDPLWTNPTQARFQPRHFRIIHDGGFQTVRMNLQAFDHLNKEGELDPHWLATLDHQVNGALDAGLNVIIDEHDFNVCAQSALACELRLALFWRQIGRRYAHASNRVIFEILNEPNGQLNDAVWNKILAIELAEIRKTNPTRNVIIGPASWNSAMHLDALVLPRGDRHIIVTVHYYSPMEFTHQGASWVPVYSHLSGVPWGSAHDLQVMDHDFDMVQAWAKEHDRPIFLGEFGAYDKGAMDMRVKYTSAAARGAEKRGWAWAYWQFDSDFIAWDMAHDRWVEPIHKALVP